jgi:hypothetical protein
MKKLKVILSLRLSRKMKRFYNCSFSQYFQISFTALQLFDSLLKTYHPTVLLTLVLPFVKPERIYQDPFVPQFKHYVDNARKFISLLPYSEKRMWEFSSFKSHSLQIIKQFSKGLEKWLDSQHEFVFVSLKKYEEDKSVSLDDSKSTTGPPPSPANNSPLEKYEISPPKMEELEMGPFLSSLFQKLALFLTNSLDSNIVLKRIFVKLVSIPIPALFSFMLDPQLKLKKNVPRLFEILETVRDLFVLMSLVVEMH